MTTKITFTWTQSFDTDLEPHEILPSFQLAEFVRDASKLAKAFAKRRKLTLAKGYCRVRHRTGKKKAA